jgi:hypothetical protein
MHVWSDFIKGKIIRVFSHRLCHKKRNNDNSSDILRLMGNELFFSGFFMCRVESRIHMKMLSIVKRSEFLPFHCLLFYAVPSSNVTVVPPYFRMSSTHFSIGITVRTVKNEVWCG